METTLEHPCHVDIEKAVKDLDDYSASQLDRQVFAFIAGWANRKGETWPCSPCLKTIANAVGKCTVTVSKSVHRLEEWGLLEISQGYLDEDEHPRNMYAIPSRYLLDETASADASASAQNTANSSGTSERTEHFTPDFILRVLSDLLAVYRKDQDTLKSEYRKTQCTLTENYQKAQDYNASEYQKAQERKAVSMLNTLIDFLNDALKQ